MTHQTHLEWQELTEIVLLKFLKDSLDMLQPEKCWAGKRSEWATHWIKENKQFFQQHAPNLACSQRGCRNLATICLDCGRNVCTKSLEEK